MWWRWFIILKRKKSCCKKERSRQKDLLENGDYKDELNIKPKEIEFLFCKKFSKDLEFWVYKIELQDDGENWFGEDEIKGLDLISYDKTIINGHFVDYSKK